MTASKSMIDGGSHAPRVEMESDRSFGSLFAIGALKPLNRLWLLIGMALHHVVTPLVMGLLFFVTLTPTALIMRALGKDPLRLRRDDAAASYWIRRPSPGPGTGSMRRRS